MDNVHIDMNALMQQFKDEIAIQTIGSLIMEFLWKQHSRFYRRSLIFAIKESKHENNQSHLLYDW